MSNKFLITMSLVFFLIFGITANVFAITAGEVTGQINSINDQITALDKEIAQYQTQIAETSQQKNTLNNTIKELTLTRNELLAERTQIQKKINATSLVITQIGNTIDTKEQSIQTSEVSLEKMMYSLYQNESNSFVDVILSKTSLEDISKEYNNTLSINSSVRSYINELLNQKNELASTKNEKISEQDKLNALKQTLIAKETAVLTTKNEQDALLEETKSKEATYQKLLADQLKKKDTFEKALEDYEGQLQFILNPKLLPQAGSGPLSWPLSSILVTSPFGGRWGSFHYGTDFRASIGTSVMAMASGTVLGTGDTDIDCKGASFGKWVFIKYNNGLSSTFGHLSVITAKPGQVVNAGDVVGLSGSTGYSLAPHLHVSVYASSGVNVATVPSKSCDGKIFTQPIAALNAYLDPMLYLPKATASMYK